jgi:hypothetical protein
MAMINYRRKSSRIIPESALMMVVRPTSSPVDLQRNVLLHIVTSVTQYTRAHINMIMWGYTMTRSWIWIIRYTMPQKHVIHLIVIPLPHLLPSIRKDWGNHHQSAYRLIVILPASQVMNSNLSRMLRMRINHNHTQSAFHLIVSPIPAMMKAGSTRNITNFSFKPIKNERTSISNPTPRLSSPKIRNIERRMWMRMNQFVCHLFVYPPLNQLRSLYLAMRWRRIIKG